MSLLQKISSRAPCLQPLEQALSAPTKRSFEADIWTNRAEFWIRRAQGVAPAFKAAKGEAQTLYATKLGNSASWTVGDAASAFVVGTQLAGCFCIGEVLARGKLTGYKQGAVEHH